jgi:hypothetical protein
MKILFKCKSQRHLLQPWWWWFQSYLKSKSLVEYLTNHQGEVLPHWGQTWATQTRHIEKNEPALILNLIKAIRQFAVCTMKTKHTHTHTHTEGWAQIWTVTRKDDYRSCFQGLTGITFLSVENPNRWSNRPSRKELKCLPRFFWR